MGCVSTKIHPGSQSILPLSTTSVTSQIKKPSQKLEATPIPSKREDKEIQTQFEEPFEIGSLRWTREWIISFSELLLFSLDSTTGNIIHCNDSVWNKILGYSKEEVQQKSFVSFIHEEDVIRFENGLKDIKNGASLHLPLRLLHKEGTYLAFDGTFNVWNNNKEISAVFLKSDEEKLTLQRNNKALSEKVRNLEQKLIRLEAVLQFQSLKIHTQPMKTKRVQVSETTSIEESVEVVKDDAASNEGNIASPSLAPDEAKKANKVITNLLERKRSFSTNFQLRKSNLGALMKMQFDKQRRRKRQGAMAKILLVSYDDEVRQFLQSQGYEVFRATSETEVLKILGINAFVPSSTTTVDVVAIDLELKQRNGSLKSLIDPNSETGLHRTSSWKKMIDESPNSDAKPESKRSALESFHKIDTFHKIRQKFFPNELPIIFLADKVNEKDERLREANDYIIKPLDQGELLARLKNLVYIKKLNDVQTCFVPREFLDLLGCRTITDIHLGNYVQKMMTVVFADIRGFSTLSESMSASDIFAFVNRYLAAIGPIVRKHRGFIDKFMGDGTLALFPKHPKDAVMAALEMLDVVQEFSFANRRIKIGIGANTGSSMLGIIGEDHRMSCDVISRNVNLASRLESLTKHYGCKIIISETTYRSCGDEFLVRQLDHVCVAGIKTPERIYEVICRSSEATEELIQLKQTYEKGRKLYCAKQFELARQHLQQLADEGDKPSIIIVERCNYFLQNPPDSSWDHVWIFDHK